MDSQAQRLETEYMDANDKVTSVKLTAYGNIEWKSPLESWIKVICDTVLDKGYSISDVGVVAQSGEGFSMDSCGGCEIVLTVEHHKLLTVL